MIRQASRMAIIWLFSFFLPFALPAIELKPWFGPMFELQSRATLDLQLYNSIDAKFGSERLPAGNVFLDLELFTTLMQNWSLEVEAIAADTRHRSFGLDSISLTGRYLWMDDVVGDPLSLATGITLYKVFKPARHDLSVFHHGGVEGELHVAAGKEFSCEQYWMSRGWIVTGLGIGDLGAAWCRADTHWEHNCWNVHHLRLSLHSVWGLGNRSLSHLSHFHGYGFIQHYSVDTGLRYTYILEHEISLSAEYAFRVYARNCPKNVNFILFSIHYPLSL
jgi:hypothetical protein